MCSQEVACGRDRLEISLGRTLHPNSKNDYVGPLLPYCGHLARLTWSPPSLEITEDLKEATAGSGQQTTTGLPTGPTPVELGSLIQLAEVLRSTRR